MILLPAIVKDVASTNREWVRVLPRFERDENVPGLTAELPNNLIVARCLRSPAVLGAMVSDIR